MTSELLKPKIVENIQGKLLKRKQIQATTISENQCPSGGATTQGASCNNLSQEP